MKKMIWIILALFMAGASLVPRTTRVLPDILKPDSFLLYENHMIIGQKHRVTIFSFPDLENIRTFGRAGEGPGEFKLGHGVNSLTLDGMDGKLVIGSIGKMSIATLDGKLDKEVKVPPFSRFLPVNGGYIAAISLSREEGLPVQGIALFNKEMKKEKILLRTGIATGMGARMMVPTPRFKFQVYRNRIYLSGDPESVSLQVFDTKGNRLYRISGRDPRVPIPREYVRKLTEYYKTSPDWKNYWNYVKDVLTFPEYFPAVRDFFIDDDLIYLQTYKMEKDGIRWRVFDLQGNRKGSLTLPVTGFFTDQSPLQGIRKGTYYYLEEDVEEEVWELNEVAATVQGKEPSDG